MTLNGWIQILVFCAIVVALVKPLGWYMTRVFNGERILLSPAPAPRRELYLYRLSGTSDREEQHWLTYTLALLAFNLLGFVVLYALQRFQAVLPVQSNGHGRGGAGPRLQHRRQLHDQHELAELRRREHDVLSRADGRPDGAELRVGRHGHRTSRLRSFAASRAHRRRASAISGPT